jgi:hypothetical protein
MNEFGWLVPFGVAGIGGFVSWLAVRIQHQGSRENRFIDQMQEQVDSLERRLGAVERREKKILNYVNTLRSHIERGGGPPAPDWPEGIFE